MLNGYEDNHIELLHYKDLFYFCKKWHIVGFYQETIVYDDEEHLKHYGKVTTITSTYVKFINIVGELEEIQIYHDRNYNQDNINMLILKIDKEIRRINNDILKKAKTLRNKNNNKIKE